MRYVAFLLILFISGCASVQMSDYISRVDHPYERKYYASFEKVTSAFVYVLKNKGWIVTSEADPATYERDDRYDNNGYQNLLITTNIKKSNRLAYSTYTHFNVLIHSIDNSSDVEIRYEAVTPLVKQFTSERNDQVIDSILDAVEQEIN